MEIGYKVQLCRFGHMGHSDQIGKVRHNGTKKLVLLKKTALQTYDEHSVMFINLSL